MRITSKGQVTIPKRIRDQLGLLAETEVDFVIEGNVVRIVKASRARGESRGRRALRRLRGTATAALTTDQIMALTRGAP